MAHYATKKKLTNVGYVWDILDSIEAKSGFFIGKYSLHDIPSHIHAHRYIQIQFILQGSLSHTVNGENHIISEGQLYVIAPMAYHKIVPTNPKETVSYYSIGFMPEFISSVFCRQDEAIPSFLDYILFSDCAEKCDRAYPQISLNSWDVAFVKQKFELMAEEFEQKNEGYINMIRSLLTEVIIHLGRVYQKEIHLSPPNRQSRYYGELFRRCLSYIEIHFSKDLRLDAMANMFGLSRTSFCLHFKNYAGTTFYNHLNNIRIRYAKSMIAMRKASITEIAINIGYADYSTFARCFKRETGLTPSEYRDSLMENETA